MPRIRRPKVILGLLTGLNLLNYLDRTVLPAVLAPVQDELHLSNFVAGWLPTIFLIGYFATSPVFGTLGDQVRRGGRSRLIAFGIAIWSAATMASGLAHTGGQMIIARAFVGLGEASYATLAPTLIDDVAPPSQKSRWMAIFYAATPIGSALGYLVGGAVLHSHGWRAAFYVAGGPGLLIALLCLFIVEPPREVRGSAPSSGSSEDSGPPSSGRVSGAANGATNERAGALVRAARELARIPLYRGTVLGFCAYTFAMGGFAYWAPAYVHRRYGLEAGHASVVLGLITVVGGLAGTLGGGWLADRATNKRLRLAEKALAARAGASPSLDPGAGATPSLDPGASSSLDPRAVDDATTRGNLAISALGAAVGAPLAALAIASATVSTFFVGVLPAEVGLFLMSGPINVALLRSSPPALRASAMALSIFAIHALGDLWSPPLIGLVADYGTQARQMGHGAGSLTGDYAWMEIAMCACPVVFAVAAVVWWKAVRTSARLT